MCKTLYLPNWSQSGTVLLREPSPAAYGESIKALTLLFDDAAEMRRLNQGEVSFNRIGDFATRRYRKDVTLGLWAMRTLLRDSIYRKLSGESVGRNYELDIYHIVTGQTRQEWIAAGGSLERLHCPLLWVIGVDSLKREYHKLYMHENRNDGRNNDCRDGHDHWRYRSSRGYSTDMRHLDPDELEVQAITQGLTPCIFAFIHELVITWL